MFLIPWLKWALCQDRYMVIIPVIDPAPFPKDLNSFYTQCTWSYQRQRKPKTKTLLDWRREMLWAIWTAWKRSPAPFQKIHVSVTTAALSTVFFAVSGPSSVEECCLYRWVLKISKETIFLPFEIQSFILQEPWKSYQGYLCKLLWTGCLLMKGRCFTQLPGHEPEQNRRFCLLPPRLVLGLFKSLFFCL